MKVAIMQPYLFPYIGYFQLINAVDKFVIYDDVNYIKRGWVNRNRILVNGNPLTFTLPIQGASQNVKINTVLISKDSKWLAKFKKTVEMAYKKAPHYESVNKHIITDFNISEDLLTSVLTKLLKSVCSYLGITTQIVDSSTHYQNTDLSGQNRILDICIQEGANHYINPIGGMEIYDKGLFENRGVKLNFIQTDFLSYKQGNSTFVSGLSILDVLMFNSKDEVLELLKKYTLV